MSLPSLRSGAFTVVALICLPLVTPAQAASPEVRGRQVKKVPSPSGTQRDRSPFNVTIEAGAIMPYFVGGGITLEGPGGFLVKTSVGGTPIGLIGLMRSLLGTEDAYDSTLADNLLDRIDTPLVWRVDLAWRPKGAHGFYLGAGYGFMRLGAQVEPSELPAVFGLTIPGLGTNSRASLSTTLHMVNAELGWEISLGSHWVLRLAAGGSFTFDVNADIELHGLSAAIQTQTAPAVSAAETSIKDTLKRYGRVPTFSVAIGYRAF